MKWVRVRREFKERTISLFYPIVESHEKLRMDLKNIIETWEILYPAKFQIHFSRQYNSHRIIIEGLMWNNTNMADLYRLYDVLLENDYPYHSGTLEGMLIKDRDLLVLKLTHPEIFQNLELVDYADYLLNKSLNFKDKLVSYENLLSTIMPHVGEYYAKRNI